MEDNKVLEGQNQAEIAEWMRKMEASNELQVKYAKRQCAMARFSAICSGCVLLIVVACVIVLAPRLSQVYQQIDTVMGDMSKVVVNLETASEGLASADLTGMLDGVNSLVEDSQAAVTEAMEKISALDVDGMNEAIADLKAVVEPLAKLIRR